VTLAAIFPRSVLQELQLQLEIIEQQFGIVEFHRVAGFWQRWCRLHVGFLKKLNKFSGDSAEQESYVAAEIKKVLRIRESILSSAMQFFRALGAKNLQEENLLAALIESSDKLWIAALERESARLRTVYAKSRRTRRVIGAYSENG
jgi:hypothetical protein